MKKARADQLHCPGCGYDLRGTLAAGERRCSECGQPFTVHVQPAEEEKEPLAVSRAKSHVLSILFIAASLGVLITISATSTETGVWVALATITTLAVIASLVPRQEHRPRPARRAIGPPDEAALVPRPLQVCPSCRYDLVGTVAAAIDRCPECGHHFTAAELLAARAGRNDAAVASLPPHEARVSGRVFFWTLLAAAGFMLLCVLVIASTR